MKSRGSSLVVEHLPYGRRVDVIVTFPMGTHPVGGESPQVTALAKRAAENISRYQPIFVIFLGAWRAKEGVKEGNETEAKQMRRLVFTILRDKYKGKLPQEYSEEETYDTHAQVVYVRNLLDDLIINGFLGKNPRVHVVACESHFERVFDHCERLLRHATVSGAHAWDALLDWANSKPELASREVFEKWEKWKRFAYSIGLAPVLSWMAKRKYRTPTT